MRVFNNLESIRGIKNAVVTTGSFDGVHIGHQVIIGRINEVARKLGGESVLITFFPHPRKILYPESAGKDLLFINTQREKIKLLEDTGLDNLVIIPFSKEFAQTTSREFIESILVEKLNVGHTVVGFNHNFGHNREGDYTELLEMGSKYNFSVEEIPEQDIQNETVSSTKIRKAIKDGYIQRANAYLNHIFMMMGELKAGNQLFLDIDRTAYTISIDEIEKMLPPKGMYACRIISGKYNLKALMFRDDELFGPMNLQFIPIDEDRKVTLADDVRINFYKRIRFEDDIKHDIKALDNTLEEAIEEVEELIY